MDQKPIARGLPWLLALALQATACSDDETGEGHFDGPVGLSVLYPNDGGPFGEPVGFVTNSRSGRITPLDLKHGRILTDDSSASFLRSSYVATGRTRILGDIATWTPDVNTVTLFAADQAFDVLVEVPYIVDVDTESFRYEPIEVEPTASDPVFYDADGSGDLAELEDLILRPGYTTTEDWALEYDGEVWTAVGSRSGRQYQTAVFKEPYRTGYRELEFTITGTATAGDRITLSTETGVVEHDVGGTIQALAMAPGGGLLAISLFDRLNGVGALVFFDPADRTVLGELPLPVGAQPYRLTWDESGDLLYVGDAALPAAYEVIVDANDPSNSPVRSLPMPRPLADLAYVASQQGERLVVAPIAMNEVQIYDLENDEFVDINLYTSAVDGMAFGEPVTGLAVVPIPVQSLQETEWGAREEFEAVAISLFEGRLVLMDTASGCLLQDEQGPRSYEVASGDYGFADYGYESNPTMLEDESTGKRVSVNACAGIARDETWEVVYDEIVQAWTVEGALSGIQRGMANHDRRYVSDDGAISFTIMAGSLPATDGDGYYLTVRDGVLDFDGDLDNNGESERTLDLPGRPTCFWYDAGPTGGGWDELDRRVFALWPITNSDIVARARLTSGKVEVLWE